MGAHVSTLANATLLSTANSWNGLLLATIPGLAQHGFQAASQIAVRCSAKEVRSVSLGRVAMSYGFGWFAGAALLSELTEIVDSQRILLLVVGSEIVMLSAIAYATHKMVTMRMWIVMQADLHLALKEFGRSFKLRV